MQQKTKQDWLEKVIISGSFIGIFLPVRIVFYTYVSDYWLGSVGIIAALAFLITYLAQKNKLGYFGRVWKKQISKLAKGKVGRYFIITHITFLFIFAAILYGMDVGQNHPLYNDIIMLIETENQIIFTENIAENIDSLGEILDNQDTEVVFSLEKTVNLFSQNNPSDILNGLAISLAMINTWSGGNFAHFYIIFFAEQVEMLALLSYFRWGYKLKTVN